MAREKAWNIFFWVWTVFLYSVGIALIPGALWILSGFFNEIWIFYGKMLQAIGGWTYLIFIVFGICLKFWLDDYLKRKRKRKEEEKDKQSTDFGWQILTDESDRKYMKEYIEDVEKDRKKADEDYKSYKKIEEHLKTPESYRIWKNRKIKEIVG